MRVDPSVNLGQKEGLSEHLHESEDGLDSKCEIILRVVKFPGVGTGPNSWLLQTVVDCSLHFPPRSLNRGCDEKEYGARDKRVIREGKINDVTKGQRDVVAN